MFLLWAQGAEGSTLRLLSTSQGLQVLPFISFQTLKDEVIFWFLYKY